MKLLSFFKCKYPIILKELPFLNSYFIDRQKYIYFSGKIFSNTSICLLSFCSSMKTQMFINLVNLSKENRISMAPVFILNGGDCGNPKCPGHLCDQNCNIHKNEKILSI